MLSGPPTDSKRAWRMALGIALAFLVVWIATDLIAINWLKEPLTALLGLHLVFGTAAIFVVVLFVVRYNDLNRAAQADHLQSLLVDQTHDSIITTDQGGWITTWNKGSEQLFGYSSEEAIGKHVAILFPEGLERHKWLDVIAPTIERGSNSVESICRNKSGGRVDTHITLSALCDDRGQPLGMIGHLMDITERKRAEREQAKLQDQLRQAQKMEAVGLLAGGIAHDFNNLLSVIIGYSELLLFESTQSPTEKERLHQISTAATRAAGLTRQLLAFSRKQVLQPVVVDLNLIIPELQKMLVRLLSVRIHLKVHLHTDSCFVKVDPGQLEQVIINLVVNARDAMPDGGDIVIEISRQQVTPDLAAQEGVSAGDYSVIRVKDTGTGMDAATRSHIFEPFFTTKPASQGTGLGLATVHGIVEQSGGHVTVESGLGQGSTFKVYLPEAKNAAAVAVKEEAGVMPRGSETILLVEDEDNVRGVTRESLLRRGYTVLEAKNGEEAMQLSRDHSGPIHLLITDMVMPGMPTRIFTETISHQRPGISILYMSGYTDALVRHGIDESAAFLQKPFTQLVLAQRVRERLDRKGPAGLRLVYDADKQQRSAG